MPMKIDSVIARQRVDDLEAATGEQWSVWAVA